MTTPDTAPDVNVLIERLEAIPVNWVDPRLGKEAAVALRTLLKRNKELERERDEFRSKLSETIGKLLVAEAKLAEAMEVIEPFAEYLDDGFDLDYEGRPLPDSNTLGWVYLTLEHLRAARSYRDKGRE